MNEPELGFEDPGPTPKYQTPLAMAQISRELLTLLSSGKIPNSYVQ